MSQNVNGARQAALEAARRAAIAAAKRAAEEAARKAAAEAAKKAVAEASRKAAAPKKPPVKPGRDEYSNGRGTALKANGLQATGANLVPAALKTDAPRLSIAEALAAQKKGLPAPASDLRTEVLDDGRANCLEKAIEAAKPGDQILLYASSQGPVGHAVVQQQDGTVVDPSDANRTYASAQAYARAHPELKAPIALSDTQAEQVVATPPGAKRDEVIRSLGLGRVADRDVAGFGDLLEAGKDAVVNGAEAVYDTGTDLVEGTVDAVREHGADMLESVAHITGGGLAAFGGTVDGFIDAVVPQDVQEALEALPAPLASPAAVLHAGQSLEDLGNTIKELPEFADAIAQAASYRAHIRSLGPGDSVTLGADGSLAVQGIVGTASGSVKIEREDDGTFKMTVSGELGLGVGGPLVQGLEGNASGTFGGELEFKFDDAEAAVRGADILMATAASGPLTEATGVTERIFGADAGDVDELLGHKSAVTLTSGGELAAELTGHAGFSGEFEIAGDSGVKVEFGEDGDVGKVVLRSKLTGSVSGEFENPAGGVNGGVSGSALIEQEFEVPDGISLAELPGRVGELTKKPEAKITLQAEAFGGASVGVSGGGMSAGLEENEGVQMTAEFTADPRKLLEGGAIDKLAAGDFDGALDAISDSGLEIDVKLEHFTTTNVSAEASLGAEGTGGGVGVSVEQRDFDDEPIFHFEGSLEDARADLSKRIAEASDDAERYLDALGLS